MIPVVLKEIIAQQKSAYGQTAPQLAEEFHVPVEVIYSLSGREPLAEMYTKIFGPQSDLNKRNQWIKQQIEHYKYLTIGNSRV